jgi:hypothetical protein
MSVIAFVKGTSTSCWPGCFCFWFQGHTAFITHGLGLTLLFYNCSLFRAACLELFPSKVLASPGVIPASSFLGVADS